MQSGFWTCWKTISPVSMITSASDSPPRLAMP